MTYETRYRLPELFRRTTPHIPVLDETPPSKSRTNPVQNRPNPNKSEQTRTTTAGKMHPKLAKTDHPDRTIPCKTLEIVPFPPQEKNPT